MKLYSFLAAVMFFSFSAAAVDYVWNGTADGNWEDAANWTPSTGYPSAPDDTATIPNPENSEGDGSSFTVTVNTPFDIASLSVGGTDGHEGKVTLLFKTGFETNSVSGDVVIGSYATVTHFGPNTTVAHAVRLQACGDMTIASGGAVDVKSKGYSYVSLKNGYGPGVGRDNGRYGGETDTSYLVGKVHGSVRRPVDYGGSVWWPGANSAGAVHLIAGGTLTVNGSINACGTAGGSTSASAGGSVWLECSNLVGAGSILAHGGACGKYSGSGGRIAIYQRGAVGLFSFTGSYTTAQTDSAMGNQAGSTCGTIYLEDASDTPGEGTLLIDDRNCTKNASYRTPLNFHMDDSTNVFGRVVVRNRGKLRIVSGLTLKVTKEISVAANSSILTESGGAIEFVGALAVRS